jgi:hypothetical protein
MTSKDDTPPYVSGVNPDYKGKRAECDGWQLSLALVFDG